METNEAKELVTSAYNSIIEKLHNQKIYDPKSVLDELHTLAKQLQSESHLVFDLHSMDQNFEKEYKSIAQESLLSYAETTDSIERINKEQQDMLSIGRTQNNANINNIMQDFGNIQNKISISMQEANAKIDSLKKQILHLEKASNLDPLTYTFNRRALDKYLGTLCQMNTRAPRTNILIVDIDDFKVVNDKYCHIAGDKVLVFLAKLINSILRDGDKVFRFGGEEFLLLLNRCDEEAAYNVADRILKGVRENTLLYKNDQIKITLSIGSAKLSKDDSFESLIDRADKALYKAKNNGKDQFVAG